MERNQMGIGDCTGRFRIPSAANPEFNFDMLAGRYVVLCLLSSSTEPGSQEIIDEFTQRIDPFDGRTAVVFFVTSDPGDRDRHRSAFHSTPHVFWDLEGKIARLFGAATKGDDWKEHPYQRKSVILDERLRYLKSIDLGAPHHVDTVADYVNGLPKLSDATTSAPVLVVPRVFEPDFCRALIDYYHLMGGSESGFMNQSKGMTVPVIDRSFKSRKDCNIEDAELRNGIRLRMEARLLPEVRRVYQFNPTRLERYIVACYSAEDNGRFGAHRDNGTKATAHRRFAVSINLNAEEFEGGNLRFPEYSQREYRPPTGGAVVFSCSLLHEATRVISGVRFATLPFLYDQEGERVRQQNIRYLSREVQYK